MEAAATPRQTRLRLNKMERWFRANTDRFTPEDQVLFRYAFEIAEKPTDANTLAQMMKGALEGQEVPA
jgi:hypothetical protein